MKYFRKFGRRRIYRKRGIRRARPVRKVSKSIRRFVKNAIHRQIENKEIIDYQANESLSGAESGSVAPSVIKLIPAISQGTGDNARIGNQVKLVSGYIRGYVNLKPYDSVTNNRPVPLYVKMWVLRNLQKQGMVNTPGTEIDWTQFFRSNGNCVGFQNNTLDLCLNVDDAYWKVEATKTLKIGAAYASSTGPVSTGGYFDNSSMSKPFYFNFTNKCKKVLKFNDNDSPYLCTNHNLYLVIQAVQADGTSTVTPAEYHYTTHWKFEDA